MSRSELKSLQDSLHRVGRGDATPSEATAAIRDALLGQHQLVDRVYEALRDVTWRTLTSRTFGEELQQWFEVFRHAAALAGQYAAGTAEKIRAHADLLSQSARFAELQPMDEVLGRKHTKRLLAALAAANGPVKNTALKSMLGLAESNLSRVTGVLLGKGLIERTSSGKEASFSLTAFGRQIARKHDIGVTEDAVGVRHWWHEAPLAVGIWEPDGNPIGANAAFLTLLGSQEPQKLPAFADWRLSVSKAARAEQMLTRDTWQLKTADALWVQFVEGVLPDGNICLSAIDVSGPMNGMDEVKNELKIARESEARLRQELADAESRVAAYSTANSYIRDEMMDVAARSNEHVRRSIGIWHHVGTDRCSVPQELHQVEKNLGAMQVVMRHLFDPVDIVDRESNLGWLDPRQMIVEAIDAASTLDPKVAATCSFGNMTRVRAAIPLRTALTYMLVLGMKRGTYAVHGALKGSSFVATLRANTPSLNSYTEHLDTMTSLGLGYCQAIVKTHGGALEMEETELVSMIRLSFPVETTRHKTGKASPFMKNARSRKITLRTAK